MGWNYTTALKVPFYEIYFKLLSTLKEQNTGILFFFNCPSSPLLVSVSCCTFLEPTATSPKSIYLQSMSRTPLIVVVVIYRKLT